MGVPVVLFDSMDDMEIKETNETMTIAGLNCKKAVITLPSSNLTFDVYYTNDIELKRPNQNNPYRLIEGVLVKFELQLLSSQDGVHAENFQPNTGLKSRLKYLPTVWKLHGSR